MGWHGSESRLYPDSTSCDYGIGFYGHSISIGSYVVQTTRGWRCYLCTLDDAENSLSIVPHDTFRTRLYLASLGLDVLIEAGKFVNASFSLAKQTLVLQLDTQPSGSVLPPRARVRLATPALSSGQRTVSGFNAPGLPYVRGAFEIQLTPGEDTQMTITWS